MITLEKMKSLPKDNFPEFIVCHHSAASEDQTFKSIQDYHISLGWENYGYHWHIAKGGVITLGRPEHYHGAHVKEQNMNTRSIGILIVGDFDKKLPTKEQEQALKTLLLELQARYSIPNEKVVPHRHFLGIPPYKSCFGKLLKDDFARNLVATPPVDKKQEIVKKLAELTKLILEL